MASEAARAANAKTDASITLHWLEKSRAQRILWLFEELGLPYKLTTHKRNKEGLAEADLKQIHPLGKSPVITVEANGTKQVVAESGFIVEYILDHFGQDLVPKKWKDGQENKIAGETDEYLRYRFFMHYAEGSLMTLMILALTCIRIKEAPVPFFIKPITRRVAGGVEDGYLRPNFKTHFDYIEEQLKTSPGGADGKPGPFLCGAHLTGADIMMSFPLDAGRGRTGLSQEQYPLIWAYVERVRERDAFKKAIQKIKDETGTYEDL